MDLVVKVPKMITLLGNLLQLGGITTISVAIWGSRGCYGSKIKRVTAAVATLSKI